METIFQSFTLVNAMKKNEKNQPKTKNYSIFQSLSLSCYAMNFFYFCVREKKKNQTKNVHGGWYWCWWWWSSSTKINVLFNRYEQSHLLQLNNNNNSKKISKKQMKQTENTNQFSRVICIYMCFYKETKLWTIDQCRLTVIYVMDGGQKQNQWIFIQYQLDICCCIIINVCLLIIIIEPFDFELIWFLFFFFFVSKVFFFI